MPPGGTQGVALIGYGYAARIFHAPLVESVAGLELRCIVSSDAKKVRADRPHVRVVAEAAHAFEDPNVALVVIATPNATHFPLARAALASGNHVVVDKPFTLTVAEARALATEAARAQLLLSVFHNRRYDADFLTLRRLIATGELGRLVYFESHFDRYRPAVGDRWRERAEPGAGLWYDLGPHLADQALQLFGVPESIGADLGVQRDGGRGVDYFHAILTYGKLRVVLHASSLTATPGPRFVVHGTLGSYVKYGLDVQEAALKAGRLPREADWGEDPVLGECTLVRDGLPNTTRVPNERGAYRRYYAAVAAALDGGGPNPVTPSDAIDVMRVIETGIASSARGTVLPYGHI